MQRTYSLKKNAQFKYVYRRGTSGGSHEMVMLYVRANTLKVGFSVGKKIGCAVERNRARRRIRETYRLNETRLKCGFDIVIMLHILSHLYSCFRIPYFCRVIP